MNGQQADETPMEAVLAGLADTEPTHFELKALRHVGISESRYDTYVRVETSAGGLYVAQHRGEVTHAALSAVVPTAREFEERHLAATGRSAVRDHSPAPGVRPMVRTGRAKQLRIDLSGVTPMERAVLNAVRTIPYGQLRPVSWVAREAALPVTATDVVDVLARNPLHLLIPCHRVAHDNGRPCDAAYGQAVGDALRSKEGMDPAQVLALVQAETVYLGSDTTRIYCHPLCGHARRITSRHRVPFRSARDARRAGYRPCRSCRPLSA
ncbi:MGMT family protein [Streptomyces purpurogeneiscleroticus]|uniref:MGMT family protein n=1 Tax=Streptomyces purpurogeneiscleroticus TaxID=68259 RepID=UPI001CBC5802|nr:MGMT family protein [Streptomyces purpurogeneiscleroticus]